MSQPMRILTVCSHNRTRSVMMAALLESKLADRVGAGVAQLRSSGFGPLDIAPIDDAVDAMRRRGLDVSLHRSSATTASLVDGADLILTAERDHVVKIAALSPGAFRRAMTLPEFLAAAARSDEFGHDVRGWVESLTVERTAGDYLRTPCPKSLIRPVRCRERSKPLSWPSSASATRWSLTCARSCSRAEEVEPDWRNGQDSNLRAFRPAAFKAAAFVHSATVPLMSLPPLHSGAPGEVPERPNGAPC